MAAQLDEQGVAQAAFGTEGESVMYLDEKRTGEVHTIPLEMWRVYLRNAANLIESRGHCKGVLEDYTGRLCLLGAISTAAFGRATNDKNDDMLIALVQVAKTIWGDKPGMNSVISWNNTAERTAEEVVTALRSAAKSDVDKEVLSYVSLWRVSFK